MVTTGAGQVVVVQLFKALAVAAIQVATGVFVRLFGLQVVAVQLFNADAAPPVQLATGTLVVVTGVGQVVVV